VYQLVLVLRVSWSPVIVIDWRFGSNFNSQSYVNFCNHVLKLLICLYNLYPWCCQDIVDITNLLSAFGGSGHFEICVFFDWNTCLRFLMGVVDWNTKQRKILNGGNLILILLTWDYWNWTTGEGKPKLKRDIKCVFHCIMQGGWEITISFNIPCGKCHCTSSGSVCVPSCLKHSLMHHHVLCDMYQSICGVMVVNAHSTAWHNSFLL
jgi:hypothetical protein